MSEDFVNLQHNNFYKHIEHIVILPLRPCILAHHGGLFTLHVTCTVAPHLSRLFPYPHTCLETNYDDIYIYLESNSPIWIFSYLDSQFGNGGVWISESPLYLFVSQSLHLFVSQSLHLLTIIVNHIL